MIDEADTEVLVGLSEEERADLQELIKTFNEERSVDLDEDRQGESKPPTTADFHKQVSNMNSSITEFRERLLKLDAKMNFATDGFDKRIREMRSGVAEFGEKLLKLDAKMKSFYKILLLSYKKTELMNNRIDAALQIIADGGDFKTFFRNLSAEPHHKETINRKGF